MSLKNNKYIFWLTDPKILYSDQKYLEFIPNQNMTRIEQLNSVTRFCIYFLILAASTGKQDMWIQLPVVVIIFCVILFYVFENDTVGKSQELKRVNNKSKIEKMCDLNEDDVVIETGNYDSNGKISFGRYQGTNPKRCKNIKYSFDDYVSFKNETCRVPTSDNPFMNPTVADFEMEMPPEACNADDDDIKDNIKSSFNENLFMDVSDLFERQNSQRQYYTIPQTNPPDQTAAAQWFYGGNSICKNDQSKCLRYEDLRFKQ